MLSSIKKIGELVASSVDIDPLPIADTKNRGYLAKVIFDVDHEQIDCDWATIVDAEKAKEYRWVGNAKGQRPQLVLTTDNPKYIMDASKKHKWGIGNVAYSIRKRLDKDPDLAKLVDLLDKIISKFFPKGNSRMDELDNILRSKGCEKVVLFTVSIKERGQVRDLVKEDAYRKWLDYVLYDTSNDEYPLAEGKCHVCGEQTSVLTNPAYPEGSMLCMYNLDKAGFISNMDRSKYGLLRTHSVCIKCKKSLVLGCNYIETHLRVKIGAETKGGLDAYIIPSLAIFNYDCNYDCRLVQIISGDGATIKNAFGLIKSYDRIEQIEDYMYGKAFVSGDPFFSMSILFGKKASSHFAFRYLIQEVPITRIRELSEKAQNVSNKIASFFSEFANGKDKWSLSLDSICDIFPLSMRQREVAESKPLIELFNSIFKGSMYPEEEIYRRAVLFAKIHRFGVYSGYNLLPPSHPDMAMCRGILKYNGMLLFLRHVGVLEGFSIEKENINMLPDEEMEKFVSLQGYSEWQRGLFVLGVFIGRVGIEQYNKGDKKKSILEKINFNGMHEDRIKLLSNQVLESMRNYRILDSYSETLYGHMKMIMDRNLDKLCNPVDNVFYILSGYAYATLKAITGTKRGEY